MSNSFITIIIIILLLLIMPLLSFRMVQSKKRRCQTHFQELAGPTWHWLPPTESQPNVCIMAPLSSSGREQGARYSCWEHGPPYPFLVARTQSACSELARCKLGFQGDAWGKKCQLHLLLHFPFSQICGTSLFSDHVRALCHRSPCIQTSQTI